MSREAHESILGFNAKQKLTLVEVNEVLKECRENHRGSPQVWASVLLDLHRHTTPNTPARVAVERAYGEYKELFYRE